MKTWNYIRITSHDQFEQYRNDWSLILEENKIQIHLLNSIG